ncbi:serine/threonine protein kinase [Candidatus Uabimicrobium amorphum]|uniref:Serine/threonine protein kinase n=1 Tax=Uabimicrobium amorphum TaxID=2596890 RepID=A0A5S9F3D7_UABAM|nr:serine/threonine-protein kinase [Candidatus Uabimicrobium amorphum]BBM83052.1 serine/threonine protein kinase [Candidatus Uabimicrobium amorphum]
MSDNDQTQIDMNNTEVVSSADTQVCSIAKTLNLDTKITLPMDDSTIGPPGKEPRPVMGGKYDVIHEINRGGMGRILLWKDRDIQRVVASKMLLSENQKSPETLQRFFEEGQITGQLEHPNIVPIHEMGLDGNNLYFTMKYVKGKSLHQLIQHITKNSDHEWTQGKMFRIFQGICDAIDYAHSKSVIHRDLKPANIMIGNFGEVMVMDWGLAKVVGQGTEVFSDDPVTTLRREGGFQTITGQIAGTPLYMSPEQARGEIDNIDHRSDIYALGTILYEMLTGERCVKGNSPAQILATVSQGKQSEIPKKGLFGTIPRELRAILKKTMAFAAENRYQNVKELSQDIQRFLDHRQVSACKYTLWDKAKNTALRYRKEISLVVFTSILFIAFFAFWSHYQHKKRSENSASMALEQLAALEQQYSFLQSKDLKRKLNKKIIKETSAKKIESSSGKNVASDLPQEKQDNFIESDASAGAYIESNEDKANDDEEQPTPAAKPQKSQMPQKNKEQNVLDNKQKFLRVKEVVLDCTHKYRTAYENTPLYRYKQLEAQAWAKLYTAAKLANESSWQEMAKLQVSQLLSKEDYDQIKKTLK